VSTHAAAAHPDGASAAAASLSLRVWWSTAAADGPVLAAQWYHISWRLAWPGRCSWAHASGPSRAPDGQGGHAACFVFVSPLVVLTLAAAAGLDCQTWRRRRLGAGLSESDMDAVCVRVRACVRACACVCACVRALERVKKGRRDGTGALPSGMEAWSGLGSLLSLFLFHYSHAPASIHETARRTHALILHRTRAYHTR